MTRSDWSAPEAGGGLEQALGRGALKNAGCVGITILCSYVEQAATFLLIALAQFKFRAHVFIGNSLFE
jgi:hypothetical protein